MANWTINSVQAWVVDEALQINGQLLATLVERIEDGVLAEGCEEVFEVIAASGEVDATIEALGVAQITDEITIAEFVDAAFAAHPVRLSSSSVETELFGFFVGTVLKASGGRAAPILSNRLIRQKVG